MRQTILGADLLGQLSRHVEGAELYEAHISELPVRFAFGALASAKSVETAGWALRIIKGGRLGFSTTTDLAGFATLADNAMQSAQFGDRATLQFPAAQATPPVRRFDPEVDALDVGALISLGEEVVAELRGYEPDLQVNASLSKRIEEVRLLNSSGLEVAERRTAFGISLDAARTREGDILVVYDGAVSGRRQDVDGPALAKRVAQRFRWAERVAKVRPKAMPVVFHLAGATALLLPLVAGLNGRQVHMKASPLLGKLGQQAFDGRFTLLDDGRLDFAVRSSACDDEGVPTARKALVESGSVKQFLYDLKTAGLAGAEPTGNGFKSGVDGGGFRHSPDVAPSTWVVLPGEESLAELLSSVEEALLVEQLLGVGQGNFISGEFSSNVGVGFLVRRGEIVGRVKNTMIAGNSYHLLKEQLIGLSDRPEWVMGAFNGPAIAVDGVSVVSAG